MRIVKGLKNVKLVKRFQKKVLKGLINKLMKNVNKIVIIVILKNLREELGNLLKEKVIKKQITKMTWTLKMYLRLLETI